MSKIFESPDKGKTVVSRDFRKVSSRLEQIKDCLDEWSESQINLSSDYARLRLADSIDTALGAPSTISAGRAFNTLKDTSISAGEPGSSYSVATSSNSFLLNGDISTFTYSGSLTVTGDTGITLSNPHNSFTTFHSSYIYSAKTTPTGVILIWKQPSTVVYGNGVPFPDKLVRETYEVRSGKLELISTEYGKLMPEETVPAYEKWN